MEPVPAMIKYGPLTKGMDVLAAVLAAAMSLFAIYVAGVGVFDNVVVSGLTVLIAVTYGFAAWRSDKASVTPMIVHLVLLVTITVLILLWADIMFRQQAIIISISPFQNLHGWIAVALITYATWRF